MLILMEEVMLRELQEGLKEVVERLNDGVGMFPRIFRGVRRYYLREGEYSQPNFAVLKECTRDRTYFSAEIRVEDEGLSGYVMRGRRFRPIRKFLHAFAHKHNVRIGNLADCLF